MYSWNLNLHLGLHHYCPFMLFSFSRCLYYTYLWLFIFFFYVPSLCCGKQTNLTQNFTQSLGIKGGSPGLVVMGDDSCLRGRGFKSRRHIWTWYFSYLFLVKTVLFVWKDDNKQKEAGIRPFLKSLGIKIWQILVLVLATFGISV